MPPPPRKNAPEQLRARRRPAAAAPALSGEPPPRAKSDVKRQPHRQPGAMAVDAGAPAPSQTTAAPTEEWPPYADPSYKMPASIEVVVQKAQRGRSNNHREHREGRYAEAVPREAIDTRRPGASTTTPRRNLWYWGACRDIRTRTREGIETVRPSSPFLEKPTVAARVRHADGSASTC